AVLRQLATGQSTDPKDHFVDIQAILSWGRLFNESTHPLDHVTRSLAVIDDAGERLTGLLQIRRSETQPAQCGMGVSDCRCERLVGLMGDRGRELPHRREAIDVRELCLRLP